MFALATLAAPDGRRVAALRLQGPHGAPQYWPLATDALKLLEDWENAFVRLSEFSSKPVGRPIEAREARLLTPLLYPRKLFCIGANYADHLEEMGAGHLAQKAPGARPFFFMKPPSTTLVGPGGTVRIPEGCTSLDWEAELVVVFGKGGRNIPEGEAMRHVAGYSMGIDFTARDLFDRPERFFRFDFVLGKGQDTMNPVGPAIVPRQFLDGSNCAFSLSVNSVLKQRGNTKHMIYTIAEQIGAVSRAVTIEPGDLMLTGSPAGVGLPRGEKLESGDVVRIEADAIGAMEVVIQ